MYDRTGVTLWATTAAEGWSAAAAAVGPSIEMVRLRCRTMDDAPVVVIDDDDDDDGNSSSKSESIEWSGRFSTSFVAVTFSCHKSFAAVSTRASLAMVSEKEERSVSLQLLCLRK